MTEPPSSTVDLTLGSDGYPAAGGVTRRPADAAESARANRRWWDAAAPAYLAEHGDDLGDVDFLWCPEGLREADAQLLGSSWQRDAGTPGIAERDVRRTDRVVRAFFRSREDGLGARLQASFVWSAINPDSLLAPDSGASDAARSRDARHVILDAAYAWRHASLTARADFGSDPAPFRVDLGGAWMPVSAVTLAVDGGEPVDAGSALMIMTLGATQGTAVTVSCDDDAVLAKIAELVVTDLDA